METNQEPLELEGKFKTATELGLNAEQYCGLVKTLAYIEAGKLMHVDYGMAMLGQLSHISGRLPFNMRTWRTVTTCGTICCLGGTAQMLGGDGYPKSSIPYELRALFGLVGEEFKYMQDITERQAGVALRGYLETGKTDWGTARKSPR